jgi:protein-L-isoaspartate(D-aspartate) O-methyltransferase
MNKKQLLSELMAQGITDKKVLHAIETIPRQYFVPEEEQLYAYSNVSLPIGHDQTISQPYIVALMTQSVLLSHPCKVLEIGTGSGYQAAILSLCVDVVYTIERIRELYEEASQRFVHLGLKNVYPFYGDGALGLSRHAPFDAILVTARATKVPEGLLQQLADGGVLIMPIGEAHEQELMLVKKDKEQVTYQSLGAVVFVPLQDGWFEQSHRHQSFYFNNIRHMTQLLRKMM